MAQDDQFKQLDTALGEFESFLDPKVATIKPTLQTLSKFLPQINTLIDSLIALMNSLKAEIQKINLGAIGGGAVQEVTDLSGHAGTFLTAAAPLVPQEAALIDKAQSALGVVGGLSNFGSLQTSILNHIDHLIGDLNQLKG
jgi:hypothetical protein